MSTHIIHRLLRVQFVRQLLGGIGGALIALVLYTAYSGLSDVLRAQVSMSPSHEPQADVVATEAVEQPAPPVRAPSAMPVPQHTMVAADIDAVEEEEDTAVAETAAPLRAGAPSLPQSGVGLWIAGWVALGVSVASSRSARMLLHRAAVRVD